MVPREKKPPAFEIVDPDDRLGQIQGLKARRDRVREQLKRADDALDKVKEERSTIMLALQTIEYRIEVLEDGQLALWNDDE